MNKTLKTIVYSVIVLAVVILIGTLTANMLIKNKIEKFITEDLPENMVRSYDELSVHTLDGTLLLTNPLLIVQNREDSVKFTFAKAQKLEVTGLSYWDYIFKKEIHIGKITLDNPSFEYYKDRKIPNRDTIQKRRKIKKPVFIDDLQLNNSNFAIYEKGKDSTELYLQNISFEINDIRLNEEIINRKIPFEYREVRASGDSIFVKANSYDNLTVEGFQMKKGDIVFNGLKYYTKYSQSELSRIIHVERDHYNLTLRSLSVDDFNYGFKDSLFFAKSKKISLNTPYLEIYRDKMVADDPSIKPLYSKSLRELPFDLTVDSVKIKDAFLKYEEKVQEGNDGGFIQFKDLNADISNVSNTYRKPKETEIKVKAVFMDNTPITVDWSFDVQNKEDQFVFKSEVGALNAERMNKFTEPNLKVRLEGQTNRTYFTIDGNNESSTTDMKINYSDFKVIVLQKDGKKKNKFLSAIVNIFVSKDSEHKEENFKEGTGEAMRNKTKSVFNLLWISVKSALQNIMM